MNPHTAVYLDYNATTPLAPSVCASMQPFLDLQWKSQPFYNASSSHTLGRSAKQLIDSARAQVAQLLNISNAQDEIVFTSGGTESINYAITGVVSAQRRTRNANHVITSAIEHDAVLETCRYLQSQHGARVTYLTVDDMGRVSIDELKQHLCEETAIVTIMHSNNEVGTIQPIRQIVDCVKAFDKRIIVHSDTSQSVGKVKVHVDELGVDLLTIAGHKLYAPKGIGALYIRAGTILDKFMHGAGQENGKRAGTENVMMIVGLGEACRAASIQLSPEHLSALRDRLFEQICTNVAKLAPSCEFRVNGDTININGRLPNTLSISFRNAIASKLMESCQHDFACSAGAACHSHNSSKHRISHVLAAMKVPPDFALGTLRFSVGCHTTRQEVDKAAYALACALAPM